MTQENHTYQAMFLLDNQEVRQNGFNAVRERVKTTLEKHGLSAKVLRLWGERLMAYPVGSRKRATYLLGWLEGSGEAVNSAKKDFYLVGPVFRCMFLREDAIPEEELAFGIEEFDDAKLVIPEETEEVIEEEVIEEAAEAAEGEAAAGEDKKAEEGKTEEEGEEKAEEKSEPAAAATEEDKA